MHVNNTVTKLEPKLYLKFTFGVDHVALKSR